MKAMMTVMSVDAAPLSAPMIEVGIAMIRAEENIVENEAGALAEKGA